MQSSLRTSTCYVKAAYRTYHHSSMLPSEEAIKGALREQKDHILANTRCAIAALPSSAPERRVVFRCMPLLHRAPQQSRQGVTSA